eukprot:TRINITY_DN2876_c0_g1_i23.p1 TRINITY_DN2876_c0_g1~~TRINITY_DN2876_c0_g1_i23.p1  ORF type:complete len:343 (+),score=85.16 TRINITY_DN2876_c0_g1_i23:161-1189(+)
MEKKGMMKAVVRDMKPGKGPYVAEIPIPKLLPNYVIVKMLACPVNISDEYSSNGQFEPTPYEPYVCGLEGAGIVAEVGEGVPKEIIGKKVSTCPMVVESKDQVGMWSQYARVPYSSCIILDDLRSCEDFCDLFINPLTILALINYAKERKAKTVVSMVALSSLGKSLLKVCAHENIDVIGVIRKESDLKTLLDLGAKYALNMESPDFEKQLKEIVAKTDTHVAFDPIGGDMPARLLRNMPDKSAVCAYGRLSGKQPDVSSIKEEMERRQQEMYWFLVTDHEIVKKPEELKKAMDYISKDINSGGDLFKINIFKRFNLDQFKEAFAEYKKVASIGKMVITPNP